jgi:cell division septum initiation protein DivIVA
MLETLEVAALRAILPALRPLTEAAAVYAPEESAEIIALIDGGPRRDDLRFLLVLLWRLAVLRGVLLEQEDPSIAALWQDLTGASEALRAPLIDAFRAALPARQEALIAQLRASAAQALLTGVIEILARADLCIAAAGDFKRGKSTVINALLGSAVLPMRVAPATAVPCAIHAAPQPQARVSFASGRPPETVPLADLERYACIRLPNEEQEVAFNAAVTGIEIGLPWPLPSGVTLLDLPGLNEEAGRSEMAAEALDAADGIVLVLSATQLLAEDELLLLDQVWAQGHRAILFAINFRDRLEGQEEHLVRERAARLLAPYGGIPDHTIFLVSARQALEARQAGSAVPAYSGFPALEARLQALLREERDLLWRASRLRQVLAALEQDEQRMGEALLAAREQLQRQRARLAEVETRATQALQHQLQRAIDAEAAIGAALQAIEDHEQHYEHGWSAVVTDLEERCHKELLPWIWQDGGPWLRERLITAIREVNPGVTPRPEGYLRIRLPSGLRFSRAALLAFYRDEAAREWDRFTAEAYRRAREALEEQRLAAEQARRELEKEGVLQQVMLDEERASATRAVAAAADAVAAALPGAQAMTRHLARLLHAPVERLQ